MAQYDIESYTDSINKSMYKSVEGGDYDNAIDLILNYNANVNYIDTVELYHGGSSPSFRPPKGGGIIGALVSVIVLPFVALGAALGSALSANRGKYYEINTVLEKAISSPRQSGKYELIELLLEKGANPNQDGYKFNYPLHLAVENGNNEIILLLIENGASVSKASARRSLSSLAIENANEELAIEFLDKGDSPFKTGSYSAPILMATKRGMTEYISAYIEKGYSVQKPVDSKIGLYYTAVLNGQEEVLELLRKNEFVLNENELWEGNNTHIFVASAATENSQFLEKEMDQLAEAFPHLLELPGYYNATPIAAAVYRNNWNYAKFLLSKDVAYSSEVKESIFASEQREVMAAAVRTKADEQLLLNFDLNVAIVNQDSSNILSYIELGAQPELQHVGYLFSRNNIEGLRAVIQTEIAKEYEYYPDSSAVFTKRFFEFKADQDEALGILLQNGISPFESDLVKAAARYKTFKYLRILMDYGLTEDGYYQSNTYYNTFDDIVHQYKKEQAIYPKLSLKQTDDGYYFEDSNKNIAFGKSYEEAKPFELGNARIKKLGKWYLIDDQGKEVTGAYDEIFPFQYKVGSHETALAMVVLESKYNFIDRAGNEVFPISFDSALPFENNYSEDMLLYTVFELEGKFGVIAENGTLNILPKYKKIIPTTLNYYDPNPKVKAVNSKGKYVFPKLKVIPFKKIM